MSFEAAIRMPAVRALTFRAWRLAHGSKQMHPVAVEQAETLDEARNLAMAGDTVLNHKDRLFIREYHDGKRAGLLHGFYVVAKAATYRRDEVTGLAKRVTPLDLRHEFSMQTDSFLPTRPFDAFADAASGRDLTLVTQ
jgi:integrase